MLPFAVLMDVSLWDEITASLFRVEVLDVLKVDKQTASGLGGLFEPRKWEAR
jgi:hypothetical protein